MAISRLLLQVTRRIRVMIIQRVLDLQPMSFPSKNLAEELAIIWKTYSPVLFFHQAERLMLMRRDLLSPVQTFSMALHSTAISMTARQIIPKSGTSRRLTSTEATQAFWH